MVHKETHSESLFHKHRSALVCLFLVLSTLVVFWQVRHHDFVHYDDFLYVTENEQVQAGLTLEGITWAFTTIDASNWHPLTWLSHMLDCELFGVNPGPHHLVNLFFHIANTLILFFVFKRMTGNFWPSGFIAALFALHPLHVESVAWIAERKDVLSTLFWLLTMWGYTRYVEHPGIARYLLTLLFFALGLMTKPMLVTLPFVLVLLDYWPFKRIQIGQSNGDGNSQNWSPLFRMVWEKIPFFILTVFSSVTTYLAQKLGGSISSLEGVQLPDRISNALVSYVGYIGKMMWPSKMAVLYPYSGELPWVKALGACLVILFITAVVIGFIKKHPYLAVGWFWYIGTLVPVIGLVQVGLQSMADRYTYVPLIGLFFMIAWGISNLMMHLPHRKVVLGSAAALVLFILMTISYLQVRNWKNSIMLFEHTLRVTAMNHIMHYNLGVALQKQGRADEAISEYFKALQAEPDYVDAHNNLGFVLEQQGGMEEAIKQYSEAIRINPRYVKAYSNLGRALQKVGRIDEAIKQYSVALQLEPEYVEAHNNLGAALEKQGRLEEAIKRYSEALRLKSDYVEAYYNLGAALEKKGSLNDAIKHYTKAVDLEPDHVDARYNLGGVLLKRGRVDEAIKQYSETLRLDSQHVKAHYNLGVALHLDGRIDQAIKQYSETLRLDPNHVDAHNNLGAALFNKGDIERAIDHFREALRISPDNTNAKNNLKKLLLIQQERQ